MKQFFIFFAMSLFSSAVIGQDYEPIELARKIFSKEGISNIKKYVTGEYQGEPSGEHIPQEFSRTFLLLQQTEKYAVVAMTLKDTAGRGLDTYLHFEKDNGWKMSAFRALAMTGFIEAAKNHLGAMTPEEIEKEIKRASGIDDPDRVMFRSREEYDYELGNARLTLDFDDNIIAHFKKNKTDFERVRNLALVRLKESGEEFISGVVTEGLKPVYRRLLISSIRGRMENISFVIGGMIYNTVGYMYVADKKDLPEMNASRYIMIREIGDGWYLYKTT